MADDLVRRLRDLLHGHPDRSEILPPDLYNPIRAAADRIEALERQVAELAAVGDAAVKALHRKMGAK